ncbi:MAG: hypothetical protein ACTHN5_05475 [Phycisphaerae bacterium]
MTPKILMVPVALAVMVLPSCMTPVNNVLKARSEARLSHLESTPVTEGACDSLGQYIAKSAAAERVASRDTEPRGRYLVLE